MLELCDLSYTLPDGRRLLWQVSHRFEPGTATVIVGPSGSGKTTLLAISAGLISPASGTVNRMPSAMADVAWVLQSVNQLGHRTVRANAQMYRRFNQRPGEKTVVSGAEIDLVLANLGLEHLADGPAGRLSGGEAQRLATARALLSDRSFVFADEPTSQLDRHNAAITMRALTECAGRGAVVVIVTHDIDSVPPDVPQLRLDNSMLVAQ